MPDSYLGEIALYTFATRRDMYFTISTPRKGSLPFVAISMVKLIEGWLSFNVDRNASAVSTLGIMLNVLGIVLKTMLNRAFKLSYCSTKNVNVSRRLSLDCITQSHSCNQQSEIFVTAKVSSKLFL